MFEDDYDFDQPVTRIAKNEKTTQQLGKIILEQAQDYLDTMSAGEHKFLQKTLNKLAEQDAYFQVLADALNLAENEKVANDALNLLHIWQVVNDCEDLEKFNLLDVINGDFFQKELFNALDHMQIQDEISQRRDIIRQALTMYKQELYVGCIPVLYAQLEGLLTSVLLKNGFLEQRDSKFIDVHKIVPGLKGHEIKSLWHKSKIASELNPYFADLAAYKMDNSSTVTATRHNILHGSDLAYFTQERSFILFLWLFSVLGFMSMIRK